VWQEAVEGNVAAILDLLVPSYGGLGAQISGDIPLLGPFGASVSINAQLVVNRVSDEVSFQVSWSKGGGLGWGAGVAATGGLILGWGASESHSAQPSLDFGASAAAKFAGAVNLSVPLALEQDPIFGQVPVALYLGAGAGAAFAGLDATRSDVIFQETSSIPGVGQWFLSGFLPPLCWFPFPSQQR
jgi:hypothetical protein